MYYFKRRWSPRVAALVKRKRTITVATKLNMNSLRDFFGPAVLCATGLSIYNAYKINGQFFTTIVYLMKSNVNMIVH